MNYQNDKPIAYDIYQLNTQHSVSSFRYVPRVVSDADMRVRNACKACLLCCIIVSVSVVGAASVVFVWSLQELVKKMTMS